MIKMWRKLLCIFNIHHWEYNDDYTRRWCSYCNKAQDLWCEILWEECIDGEPIK